MVESIKKQLNPVIQKVRDQIAERSQVARVDYLQRLEQKSQTPPSFRNMSCSNLAHGTAVLDQQTKEQVIAGEWDNIGIVSAYNEMLSAHQPYVDYPEMITEVLKPLGFKTQFAGGVPAMCDGITQGMPGMELSLFSRDSIARATAIALSHDVFRGAVLLGICDKIIPGLIIGSLSFGHLPIMPLPAGPMPTGLSNEEKGKTRQQFTRGDIEKSELLSAEMKCYHGAGTCTFFGTANTNQMLMEFMGLHLPGASFVNPGTPLRSALNEAALAAFATRVASPSHRLGVMLDERAWVNALVGLLATGGSTNLTLHLTAMAKMAGIILDWTDYQALSEVVPLLARVYPNGTVDVNRFQALGGVPFCIRELCAKGLLFDDTPTMWGEGLQDYHVLPKLVEDKLVFEALPEGTQDSSVLSLGDTPFSATGGLQLLTGNLGKAMLKTSSLPDPKGAVEAPALIFTSQDDVAEAYRTGALDKDVVVVVLGQGPRANGMPELHKLTPILSNVMDKGFQVALVTDGRMSGASGRVPAAIHCVPEALNQGPLARLRSGDIVRVDWGNGVLSAQVSDAVWDSRIPTMPDLSDHHRGCGRELFGVYRDTVSPADEGAATF